MPEETEKTSIKELFQSLSGEGVEVWQGVVKSVSPLRIQAVNDEKLIIGPNITYVPQHLTDYHTTIDIIQNGGTVIGGTKEDGSHSHAYSGTTEGAGGPPHSHGYSGDTQATAHVHKLDEFNIYNAKIVVHNALKVGERVHVLSFKHGKQHFVLDRVG